MKGWIANTHHGWFDFLAQKRVWPEVNFWTPSDYYALHGEPGSPFFFRLLAPRNKIRGFGYVQRVRPLTRVAGVGVLRGGNGSPSFEDMSARLAAIRARSDINGRSSLRQIGCIILADAVFFPPEMWVPQPPDWKKANLRYEGYSLTEGEGRRIWDACLPASRLRSAPGLVMTFGFRRCQARRTATKPVLVRPRTGRGRLPGGRHRRIRAGVRGDRRAFSTCS
ncbi:MAG: hypothetical protein R2712_12270 [Vicinamibacterales bacterium]